MFVTRILYIILLYSFISLTAFAQKPKFRSIFWLDNWKLEIKTGTVSILTPVPDKYLSLTNNLNVPVRDPSPLGIFSAKKSLSPHFEVGYQFDYLRLQGDATDVNHLEVKVLTQIFTHTFLVQYNFKRNDDFSPLLNYFIYSKMGGVSLNNKRVTPLETTPNPEGSKLNSNVAIMSGLGAGINYQLRKNLSLTAAVDINRTADAITEVIKLYKIPIPGSSHTGNNFVELSIGLTWWFNFRSQKRSSYYRIRSETEKQLIQSKIAKRQVRISPTTQSIWYDNKKGR